MSSAIDPLVSRGVLASVVIAVVARFLAQAYQHRSRVRSLKAQGLPILPHSLFFGHLPILADFQRAHPPDVNIHVFHTWLSDNCTRYFPGRDYPPPVVYLDLWPVTTSLAIVNDPGVASQFTVVKNLPKVGIVKQYIEPLTSKIDIFCAEGALWKTWRTKLNPVFSKRNLMTLAPELIEEVTVFANNLRNMAGEQGKWGPVFCFEKRTIDLTFDVICRAVLDMRLHEQSRDSNGPLKSALMDQLRLMGIITNAARGKIFGRMPWDTTAVNHNNRIMHAILLSQIKAKFEENMGNSQTRTIIDTVADSFGNRKTDSLDTPHESVNILIANLKMFLFAGHDTTSSTICFMAKLLHDNPKCLAKLRQEHDDVFGPDPDEAARILAASPHLLSALPYTLGVIKETLRLYPQAATIREAPHGFCLTDNSSTQYPVGGFGLWLSAPSIHYNPHHWPRAEEFLPERWVVSDGDPLHPPQNAFVPFSLGPRTCIGIELAMMELKLVSVLIFRTFDIREAWEEWDEQRGSKATPSHVVNGERLYRVGISTVHPKDGMPVNIRLRTTSLGTI
ncbi:putative cytochrome P450 4V3 [Rosellinia necatrix]|uniref:Putative cytochrome P450 4V3 n=1 Tax=Rosellinia necatrix TaxID=77044 RepID=A0A1W2TI49_ROSNE|nr:putative cytochrome P450 4V3 [Rosellinia necatrix]